MSIPQDNLTLLTLQQCKKRLWTHIFLVAALSAFSASMLFPQTGTPLWVAGCFLFGVLGQSLYLVKLWKQYQLVKQGGVVYVRTPQNPTQLPPVVSIIIISSVTIFIGLCSAFIVYLAVTYFNTQLGWTVCGPILLALWLFIGYCWYRVFTEKPRLKTITIQEQPEGVWPPAPSKQYENNKD